MIIKQIITILIDKKLMSLEWRKPLFQRTKRKGEFYIILLAYILFSLNGSLSVCWTTFITYHELLSSSVTSRVSLLTYFILSVLCLVAHTLSKSLLRGKLLGLGTKIKVLIVIFLYLSLNIFFQTFITTLPPPTKQIHTYLV